MLNGRTISSDGSWTEGQCFRHNLIELDQGHIKGEKSVMKVFQMIDLLQRLDSF